MTRALGFTGLVRGFILFNRIGRYAEGTENLFLPNPYSAGHRKVKIMLDPFYVGYFMGDNSTLFTVQLLVVLESLNINSAIKCLPFFVDLKRQQCLVSSVLLSVKIIMRSIFFVKRNKIWGKLLLLLII